ncbi:MAG: ABC transporter ATP-binding protein [Vicinamibacterales bacterium]
MNEAAGRGGLTARIVQRSRLLARAFRLVWESAPGWTLAGIGLVVVQGVLPLVSLYLLKLVVDTLTLAIQGSQSSASARPVIVLLAVAGCVALLEVLARSAASFVSEAQTQTVTDHLSDLVHEQAVMLDLSHYEDPRYYDMLHRAKEEAGWRPTYLVNSMFQTAQGGLSLVTLAGLLLSLNWVVAGVLVCASLPSALLRLRYANRLYRWHRTRTHLERRSWYVHTLLTEGQYAKEVRLFDLAGALRNRFRELRVRLRAERLGIARDRSLVDSAAQGGATLAAFGTYAFLAYRTVQGAVTLGGFVLYFQAFQRGQAWLRDVLNNLAALYEGSLFLGDLFDFLDLKPAAVPAAQAAAATPSFFEGTVVFENVSYVYPGTSRKALDGVSFSIRPGEHVALVGENGSGKTTLVKLLCRLYEPTEGRITIDGIDLADYDPAAFRRQIAVMFQDYARYQLTARENIGFGNLAAIDDLRRIATAAGHAGADTVIEALPSRYETALGRWFEDGVELSAGDWQRVALARAFVREDARIVVLDEPTSALDAKVEHELLSRLRKLSRDRTTLVISHRMSSARLADRILVLAGGRLVESGTHDQLVGRGGPYATLYGLQAERYR